VKDLSLLNRDVARSIIVDNSPMSYTFHPGQSVRLSCFLDTEIICLVEYAIDCGSFIDDPRDVEMWQVRTFACIAMLS
jgi:carboxy-terminal domain RNA polymerase II polypeptide A small phosphatase